MQLKSVVLGMSIAFLGAVGFVGGSKTGAAIMAAAANGVRKVGLELGDDPLQMTVPRLAICR